MFLKIFKAFYIYNLSPNFIFKNEMFDKTFPFPQASQWLWEDVFVPDVINTSWETLSKGESVLAHGRPRFTCSPVFLSLVPALPRAGRTVEVIEFWHSSKVSRNLVGPRRTSGLWLLSVLVTKCVTFLKSECWKDCKCCEAGTSPRDGASLWYVSLNWKEALAHLQGGKGDGPWTSATGTPGD